MKAHVQFMCQVIDYDFNKEIRFVRQSHERYLSAIIINEKFPGLEDHDPLNSKENEVIPEKYGKQWLEY